MILSTEQQAHNFALYSLAVGDPLLEGLNYESLVGALMSNIVQVFGRHTFSERQLENIAKEALKDGEGW